MTRMGCEQGTGKKPGPVLLEEPLTQEHDCEDREEVQEQVGEMIPDGIQAVKSEIQGIGEHQKGPLAQTGRCVQEAGWRPEAADGPVVADEDQIVPDEPV
jgi:hypothetical protein